MVLTSNINLIWKLLVFQLVSGLPDLPASVYKMKALRQTVGEGKCFSFSYDFLDNLEGESVERIGIS